MNSNVENINLRKPSTEEINQIIAKMVAQVQSNYGLRNIIVNDKLDKSSSIFIKDITQKVPKANKKQDLLIAKIKDPKSKKWEAKRNVPTTNNDKKESIPIKLVI